VKSLKDKNQVPENQHNDHYDLIIVGAGLAGLTVALEVAAHKKIKYIWFFSTPSHFK
jgi:L-aspartate oxidase